MSTLQPRNQACGTAFRACFLRRLGWTTSLRTPPGEASSPAARRSPAARTRPRVALRAGSTRPSAWRKTAVTRCWPRQAMAQRRPAGRLPTRPQALPDHLDQLAGEHRQAQVARAARGPAVVDRAQSQCAPEGAEDGLQVGPRPRRCATAARRPSRRCWCAGRGPRDGSPRWRPAAAGPPRPRSTLLVRSCRVTVGCRAFPAHGLAVAAEQLAQGAALRTGQAQLLEQGRQTELPHGPQGDVLDADRARADRTRRSVKWGSWPLARGRVGVWRTNRLRWKQALERESRNCKLLWHCIWGFKEAGH